jgi:hypothetical protein
VDLLGLKLNVEAGHQSYSDFVRHKIFHSIFHSGALYWILDNKQRWKIRFTVWLLLDGFEWTFLGLKLNSSPRQYFKSFGLQSFRGRAPTDLTVLKKLPPSQPSWPRAGGNKHIFGGLCRRNL